jgi:diguanylate cyclase
MFELTLIPGWLGGVMRSRYDRLWWGAIVIGGLSIAVFLMAPRHSDWQLASFFVPLLLATGLVFMRMKGRSPSLRDPGWVLLCSQLAYFVASLFWYLWPIGHSGRLPFPSPLDVLYFLAYAGFALFLVMVLRRRSLDSRAESRLALTDALILTVTVSAVVWVTVIGPTLSSGTTLFATFVAVLYPGFTLLMFALAARLAIGSNLIGSVPGVLLLLWVGCEIGADIFYGAQGAAGTFEYGTPLSAIWIASYTALAALAAHPHTARLLAPEQMSQGGLSQEPPRGRTQIVRPLTLLAAAVVPVVLAFGHTPRNLFLLVSAVLGVTLVTLRTSLLTSDLHMERQVTADLDDALKQLSVQKRRLENQSQEMTHLALHDPVTGLGNRAQLSARAVEVAGRWWDTALLLIDLDGFKEVNDTLGHALGDALLLQVGDRLGHCVRTEDTVVRLGGDEFVMLLPHTGSVAAALTAERVLVELRKPFELDGVSVQVRGSLGIASGGTATSLDEMLRNADLAMYQAKAAGRDQACEFHPEMYVQAARRLEMDTELRAAIDSDEFAVYYQPIIDATSSEVCSVEALVRWVHRDRGVLAPLEFLPALERTGLIVEVGRFVLRTACGQVAKWRQDWPELCVAVNVAHQELLNPDFAENVILVLEQTGLPAHALHLEITETVLATDSTVAHTLDPLVAAGVHLSIDDFGTGHSSLSRLRGLSVTRVKIDQSFVAEIGEGITGSAPLLTSIIALTHSVGHIVVAEGVETQEQAAFLTANGCDELQGYYFSRPVPAEQLPSALLPPHEHRSRMPNAQSEMTQAAIAAQIGHAESKRFS